VRKLVLIAVAVVAALPITLASHSKETPTAGPAPCYLITVGQIGPYRPEVLVCPPPLQGD
jgi:hypothetical protein